MVCSKWEKNRFQEPEEENCTVSAQNKIHKYLYKISIYIKQSEQRGA